MINISEVIELVCTVGGKVGYSAYKELEEESRKSSCVYEYMDKFAYMLESKNSYIRNRGILLIAANAKWDKENKINEIIDKYLYYITDEKPITSRQCIKVLPEIVKYKPELKEKVLTSLYKADTSIYNDSMKPLVCRDIDKAIKEINFKNKKIQEDDNMTVFDELKARGLLAQLTDEEEIKELINAGKATFYIGFDPTADSLHVGHFMALCLMKRLQMAGNKPIALIGGGTAMIGDPSGRTDMRQMMTKETIQHNVDCFKKQMSRFIDFSEGKALLVNNADWLLDLNYVELLREVGSHFSVNRMLTAECYKQRMEKGLSFLEFNYMIMQSYDFYELFKKYGCNMQFGGDDQWSNMLGGTELIRRKLGEDAYAMTITLLLNSEGKKMGKTQSGAVWLDPDKTSPYDFYQYWRNVADDDVLKCIRMLTFLPLEQINEMDKWEGSQLNKAKEILAYELTSLVHGEEEAKKAETAAKALFGGGPAAGSVPTTEIDSAEYGDGLQIIELLEKCGLIPSRGEGRRLVQQGGVKVNGEKVTDIGTVISPDMFDADNAVMIQKGKKTYHQVKLV